MKTTELTATQGKGKELRTVAEHKCRFCGEEYSKEDLRELREMGEPYSLDGAGFICPDCYDAFSRLTPEDQVKELLR